VCGIVAAIKQGKSIEEKTEEIHQELLIDVADALLKKSTHASIEGLIVLVMLYHDVGCGGEVLTSD
jgi:hypothetical protein